MVNKQYSATDLEAFMKLAANWQSSNHNLLEGVVVDLKGEMQQFMNNPSMNMYKKRERTQNWNHQEKKFLLDLCRKDMRIIENKRLDAGLTAVKNKAWKIIHQKFSSAFGTDRTCNRLKEQWRRMKACTRNEILDYNNRLTRFGAEVADRKKPSHFTFEVWDFMQEAKRACKSEALDGIDYSTLPLALEEDFEYREDEHQPEEEHDMDDSRTPPQDLCDVDVKEETFNETYNDAYNDSLPNGAGERLSASPHQRSSSMHDSHESDRIVGPHSHLHSPAGSAHAAGVADHAASVAHSSGFMQHNGDINYQPAFSMNNISATLEALNALRSGQFPTAAAAAAAAALQSNFAAAAVAQQQQQQQQHHHNHHHHQQQQQQQQLQPIQVQPQIAAPNDEPPAPKRPCPSSSTCGSAHEELLLNNSSSSSALASASVASADAAALTANVSGSAPCSATATPAVGTRGGNGSNHELQAFMEMQSKEHMLRMQILEVQLQAAKYSRDIVEINKTLALQKLQALANKRMS